MGILSERHRYSFCYSTNGHLERQVSVNGSDCNGRIGRRPAKQCAKNKEMNLLMPNTDAWRPLIVIKREQHFKHLEEKINENRDYTEAFSGDHSGCRFGGN
jgi:hypothetical protein